MAHWAIIGLMTLMISSEAYVRADNAPTDLPYLIDVNLGLRYTARQGEPRTWLTVDPATSLWSTDTLLTPNAASDYPSMVLVLGGEVEPLRGLLLRFVADSGVLEPGDAQEPSVPLTVTSDGREVIDTFSSGAFVRELNLNLSSGALAVNIGRRYDQLADGLVFEDYGTGMALAVELGLFGRHDFQARAVALAVGNTFDELRTPSPLLWFELEHRLSLFESVRAFGAVFYDRGGILSDVVASSKAEGMLVHLGPTAAQEPLALLFESDIPSRGHLNYVGFDGNLLPADGLSLRGATVVSWGRLSIGGPMRSLDLNLRSWAASFNATYGLTPTIGIGAFAFGLSGDRPPRPTASQPVSYGAFIGVAPYWTWSSIFFSGGLSQGLYPGRATAGGVNGHGAYGGGPKFDMAIGPVLLEARVAYLRAVVPSPPPPLGGGGLSYGFEADVALQWDATSWLTFGIEADLFMPGPYFPSRDLAYRAIGQVDVHVGN